MLTDFITSVSSHLARKRTADTFLAFLTNSSSMVIVFLNELSTAFETTNSTAAPEQAVSRYLELFPESSLANVLADQQQRKKLNMIADDILSSFLDQKAYSCYVLRDFLREVLAGVIFQSMMSNFSRPEFINGWIIYLLSEGESEIMNAIDAGVEGARSQGVTAPKGSDVKNNSSMNTAVSAEIDPQVLPQTTGGQSNHSDKATEEAIKEAKRLSAMIAAQDAQRQDLQQAINEDRRDPVPNSADDSSSAEALDQVENSVNKDDKQTLETSESLSHRQRRLSSSPSIPSSSRSNNSISEIIQGPILTLYGASVSVDVELEPGEKTLIRSKPTSNYLIQVEPASTRCSGWMTFKKYADFESLHDTLEAISRLNKLWSFTEMYPALPTWKGHTRQALAQDLARYLKDALQHESLAESEKMKRFLDKDNRLGTDPAGSSTRTGFSFPSQATFENMGKGVLGALANAPKGVAGGSKAVLGGVTGVFGNVGGNGKRSSRSFADQARNFESSELFPAEMEQARNSGSREVSLDLTSSSKHHTSPAQFTEKQNPSTMRNSSSSFSSSNDARLPPNARSDRSIEAVSSAVSLAAVGLDAGVNPLSSKVCQSNESPSDGHDEKEDSAMVRQCQQAEAMDSRKQATPDLRAAGALVDKAITNDETQIAVELIFAVINELYTLSSAWNIRRTLLNAAKSYILRPGSPTLETIRVSLQDSIINANTSDETIGAYLTKLRENALPTETEMKSWPPPPTEVEKERLRENARKLLVQRGLPQALTSVMGAVASREALEKIFDCLQVETIARGFVFTILLQVLRAVII